MGIVLIAQAPALLDKQVREAVVEGYARCRRTDRMKVPFMPFRFPRFHVAAGPGGPYSTLPATITKWRGYTHPLKKALQRLESLLTIPRVLNLSLKSYSGSFDGLTV